MKRKKFLISTVTVAIMLFSQLTAYAQEVSLDSEAQKIEAVRTFVAENASRVVGSPRGMLISSVELSMTDLGGGTVELYGNVLCHEPMEKIKLNLYLDKWLTDTEAWGQIDNFSYTWLAEDYPDEDLTMAVVSLEVPDLERGKDYQLRGIAGAWDLDSDLYEVFRADVPSIMLE